jgi:GNAT superfamily N-acetyltransferase
LASTYHFGYFIAEQLIGVISLFEVGHPTFDHQKSFQIRGMAILAAHQKKGFGEALVLEAEAFCKKQKATLIWFNARSSAVGFYKKMGYDKMGSEFEIKDVGPHFLMFKTT